MKSKNNPQNDFDELERAIALYLIVILAIISIVTIVTIIAIFVNL